MSLQPELDEPVPVVNDSGFYGGDGLSRHSSNSSGLHRDSCSSDIVTEGGLILGTLSVAPETSWVTMDTKIGNIFMVSYISVHALSILNFISILHSILLKSHVRQFFIFIIILASRVTTSIPI